MVGAGDSNSDLQFACSSGSEEMQRRGREEMPRIPAPPTAADGLDTAAGGWAFRSVFKRNDPYGDAEKLFAARAEEDRTGRERTRHFPTPGSMPRATSVSPPGDDVCGSEAGRRRRW
jgi:hypothetical protein